MQPRSAKNICFPATFRGHLARQKLLLDELHKSFKVDIFEPEKKRGNMSVSAILYAIEFNNFIDDKKYDAILIRGDRYEMLGIAMVSAYRGIPIVHLEGGDESGAIDNKVRHAITQLADWHFCTNDQSLVRLIQMGIRPDKIWNYGSLDVEFAMSVQPKRVKDGSYILVAYHCIPGEDENEVSAAIVGYNTVRIISNADYGRQYGEEIYSPEDYINLIRYASCCVGNSSSFLKEASILGTPVVNVGFRQTNRLKPMNVLDVTCKMQSIADAIRYQLAKRYDPDPIYYKENTSQNIADKLKEIL